MNGKKQITQRLENKRSVYFQIGLTFSLGLSLLAFEWKSPVGEEVWKQAFEENEFFEIEMPVTRSAEPIKAPVVSNTIKPVEKVVTYVLPVIDPDSVVVMSDSQLVVLITPRPEVPPDEPFIPVPEIPAGFPGGEKALVTYLNQRIYYPSEAKRNRITGLVYVCFEVSSTGKIEKAEVMRGIGGGCDEVALAAVRKMPDWEPAMQGGRFVRTQLCLPVNFSLK